MRDGKYTYIIIYIYICTYIIYDMYWVINKIKQNAKTIVQAWKLPITSLAFDRLSPMSTTRWWCLTIWSRTLSCIALQYEFRKVQPCRTMSSCEMLTWNSNMPKDWSFRPVDTDLHRPARKASGNQGPSRFPGLPWIYESCDWLVVVEKKHTTYPLVN